MKVKLVAYKKENGQIVSIYECKNVDDREYNEMLNQELAYKQLEFEKEKELLLLIEKLNDKLKQLEHEIKVLKGEDENEESN